MQRVHPRPARAAGALLVLAGLWALPAGAQEFAIPAQAELDAMTPAEKITMERALTQAAADWPLSELEERVIQPEMAVWSPVRGGEFEGADSLHRAEGRALVANDSDAGHGIVRLEDLSIANAPGLHVYLVIAEAPKTPEDIAAGFLDAGPLKANRGSHNYVFSGTINEYRSAVIFSKPFGVIVAVATLTRAGA